VSKLVFQPKWVNVYVTPSPEDPTWTGILGNANGDRDDDFITRDGQSLGVEPGQAVIEGAFADSWRLTDATSLFEYEAGESTATFTEVTYPAPHPEMDASELASDREARQPQAEAVCQLVVTDPDVLDACVSDFAITGSHLTIRDSARTAYVTGLYARMTPTSGGSGSAEPASQRSLPENAELAEPVAGHVAHGSGLALMRIEVPDGDEVRGDLVAIDLETRSIRWTAPDIATGCNPTVIDGIGVVAQAQSGSPRLGEDASALVLLSILDGTELDRMVPEDPADGQCATLVSGGDGVVVARRHDLLWAHRINDDSTFSPELWRRSQHGITDPVVVDGKLVVVLDEVGTDATKLVLGLVDLATGETTSELRLDSWDQEWLTPVGDGLVAVKMRAAPATLALLDASTDELRVRWSISQPAEDGRPPLPDRFARAGDVLTGWTKHSAGRGLIAYNLADGSTAWTYTATSFENNHGAIAGTSGAAYIGPFGGAWAEVVGADGDGVRIIDTAPTEGWFGPTVFTQVGDETVLAMGDAEGTGPYFTFLDD
jgi:hypothetical protein